MPLFPKTGDWIEKNGERLYVAGKRYSRAILLVEYECGTIEQRRDDEFTDWVLLEGCTGFDWSAE
jgi:hypothetical protein